MEKQTYEKLAYYTIKEKILSGKLHVGQHISEAGIEKNYLLVERQSEKQLRF